MNGHDLRTAMATRTGRTVLTMANGKGIDLLDPNVSDIDFAVIAEHLAKEKRYNGATPDAEYSVAQHSALGADAIIAAGGSEIDAAYFLLHDAHEALVKDLTTPLKEAIGHIAGTVFRADPAEIVDAFHILEESIADVIYLAAELDWPARKDTRELIKKFDLIMFVTEWRDLMHGVPHPNWEPYSSVKPLRETIVPWPWTTARAGWLRRAAQWLPALKAEAA